MSVRKPRYGDVYRMPNGALWMVIAPDGDRRGYYFTHSSAESKQWYYQLPLTDDPDEGIKAFEDTATGYELGEYVRD